MKFRIGHYDDKYWVEGKIKGKWYKMPLLNTHNTFLRPQFDKIDDLLSCVKHCNVWCHKTLEDAEKDQREWLFTYSANKVAVYTTPKG